MITHLHGIQLDVCLEQMVDEATVYDIEPERDNSTEAIKALPKRVRFYHALKNEVIIIITPFDPFGLDRMLYTVKNRCIEEPDMPYEDGAMTIFLYTKGKAGIMMRRCRYGI